MSGADTFVGIFVTSTLSAPTGTAQRIYGVDDTTDPADVSFSFPGLDGQFMMALDYYDYGPRLVHSDELSGVELVFSYDADPSLAVNGAIYVAPAMDSTILLLNPIYKTADGSVYVMMDPAHPTMMSLAGASRGGTFAYTLPTKPRSGDVVVTLTASGAQVPQSIAIVEMSDQNQQLSRAEYAPDAMPDDITPSAGTAYLVVETVTTDQDSQPVTQYDAYDHSHNRIDYFDCRSDGLCRHDSTSIDWPQ